MALYTCTDSLKKDYNLRYKILIFVFLILTSAVLLNSCDDKFVPPKSNVNSGDSANQESWNSTVIFSDSGSTKAVLKAGHISVFKNQGYTLIDSGASVDFFRNGEIVSTLTGMRGKIYDVSKNIEIYDSVVVVNKEGSELRTQKLNWENKTQKVYSDLFVSIKTPGQIIEGVGFESDQSLKNYKIFKVSGTFTK